MNCIEQCTNVMRRLSVINTRTEHLYLRIIMRLTSYPK